MISPTASTTAPALDLLDEFSAEADETLETAVSQRINARRALEENIEILRQGRAL